jgi:hypothetical protein
MNSAYADDIVIIVKHRGGNLNRVIKLAETEFGKLIQKLNKKNAIS